MKLKPGQRVLVLGLGLHGGGVGVTKWLVQQGAEVIVTDLKPAEQLAPSLAELAGLAVRYTLGEHRESDLDGCDLVVRNPAVPRESPFLEVVRRRGIPIEMEMGLFFTHCPAPIIGITGTKGKTTTTLLIGEILRQVNPDTVIAGNLRVSALEYLDQITATTPVVLELSSWQLEGLVPHQISPHIACVTNVYPDHLNRYRDLEDYAASKQVIFEYQHRGDAVVLNHDNPVTRRFGEAVATPATRVWFSHTTTVDGVYWRSDHLIWRWRRQEIDLIAAGDLQIPGQHNRENAAAAAAIAFIWGAKPAAIRAGLRAFRGVPHRQELVAEINGVRYINDTTATAPAATLVALDALADRPVILIAGGADKGLDFTGLAQAIAQRVKAVILLEGTATDRLAAAITAAGGAIVGCYHSLAAALAAAQQQATAGDTVLLSPACASFGLFVNEFDRGDQFRTLVQAMKGSSA